MQYRPLYTCTAETCVMIGGDINAVSPLIHMYSRNLCYDWMRFKCSIAPYTHVEQTHVL